MTAPVYAVIVTFQPQIEGLKILVKSLIEQRCYIVIVDNGSGNSALSELLPKLPPDVHWICLPESGSLGLASNIGMQYALGQGAEYVSFLNQGGKLIAASTLEAVGLYDATVGDDYVFQEWEFRAVSKGLNRTEGTCNFPVGRLTSNLSSDHGLFHPPEGDKKINVQHFLHVLRYQHLPVRWKVKESIRIVKQLMVHMFRA